MTYYVNIVKTSQIFQNFDEKLTLGFLGFFYSPSLGFSFLYSGNTVGHTYRPSVLA